MKRTIALTVVAACALSGAVAVAATPKTGTFKAGEGQVQRGYDLKFKVDQKGKRIKGVVAHVLETCDSESTSSTTTVGPRPSSPASSATRFKSMFTAQRG